MIFIDSMNGAISQNSGNPMLREAMQIVLRIIPTNTEIAESGQGNPEIPVDTCAQYTWTREQFGTLYDVLLNAFNRDELRILVSDQFGQDLVENVGGEGKAEITFNLMRFLEARQDGLTRLLKGAIAERPESAELQALMASLDAMAQNVRSDAARSPIARY